MDRSEFRQWCAALYYGRCDFGEFERATRGRWEALARYGQDWDEQGTPVWYSTWLPLLERFRARVGELLNAPAGSTAIAPSVSVALTSLATGLPLRNIWSNQASWRKSTISIEPWVNQ